MQNKNPEDISIEEFDYTLPDDFIARYPLEQRDDSKLLVYRNGTIQESVFRNLKDFLEKGDCLVLNNTRVVHARLIFQNDNQQNIEIFCLNPLQQTDPVLAFASTTETYWNCLVGNNRKWKSGNLRLEKDGIQIKAERAEMDAENFAIKLSWTPQQLSFSEVIEKLGSLPLPPYLNRDTEKEDYLRYQTIYARHEGSVAAPTAGLHFTERVFADLVKIGVERVAVSLHVGAGTFMPVKSATMKDHEMHREFISIEHVVIKRLADANNIIAVGTTSLRTIESVYWYGVKLMKANLIKGSLLVDQWEPYQLAQYQLPNRKEVFEFLDEYMKRNKLDEINGYTRLMIAPGYQYRVAQTLITNFHQPKSTLLLLVSALLGDDWRKVYDYALQHNFRFLSYGDSSILFGNKA
jgi:S-adenosylmethionine:tRNA ribosyltransferase-isomerase